MQADWHALQPMQRDTSMSFATSGWAERPLGGVQVEEADRSRMSWDSRAMAAS